MSEKADGMCNSLAVCESQEAWTTGSNLHFSHLHPNRSSEAPGGLAVCPDDNVILSIRIENLPFLRIEFLPPSVLVTDFGNRLL